MKADDQRTININGVYLGTDKLSHFISTGLRYFKRFNRSLKKGNSLEESYKKAIDYGIFLENTFLGLLSSHVFSHGDLEANFQGLLFNIRLCSENDDGYLEYKDNKWILKNAFDIKEYINPYWDETFNPSSFTKGKWKKMKDNLINNYCPLYREGIHLPRFSNYERNLTPSFSIDYINELLNIGKKAPAREQFTLKYLCN